MCPGSGQPNWRRRWSWLARTGAFRQGLRNNTNIGDAGLAQSVDDLGKRTEGNGFIGAQEDRVLGLFKLRFHFRAELVDVDRSVAEINQLLCRWR